MRVLLKNVLLLTVVLVVSLIGAEFVVRFVLRDITTTADNRSYFALRWKRANVQLNALGYREREIDATNASGAYRVAFIGDSFTFGQGIATHERMTNLLERELRARGRNIEVLNFGNAGDNTADQIVALRKLLPHVRPNFVVLQWFVNDVELPASSSSARPANGPSGSPSLVNEVKSGMRHISALYFLAAEVWHAALTEMGRGYLEDMRQRFGDPSSPASLRAEAALAEFVRTSRDAGVPVGFVLIPHLGMSEETGSPFDFLHDRVAAFCDREEIPLVDLRKAFNPYLRGSRYAELWVNRFDSHMGPLANRLAAAEILGTFAGDWGTANPRRAEAP